MATISSVSALLSSMDIKAVVIKQAKSESDTLRIKREVEVLSKIDNKHIVRLVKDVLVDNGFAMEFAGEDLLSRFSRSHNDIHEDIKKRWLIDIADGLSYLHNELNLCHCDIRLGNVLLHNNSVRICDLECCEVIGSTVLPQTTINYVPPEAINVSSLVITPSYDIYCFGLLMIAVFLNNDPYSTYDQDEIKRLKLSNCIPQTQDSLINNLCENLCSLNSKSRPNVLSSMDSYLRPHQQDIQNPLQL